MIRVIFVIFSCASKLAPGAAKEQPEAVRSSQRAPGEVRKPRRSVVRQQKGRINERAENRREDRERRGKGGSGRRGGKEREEREGGGGKRGRGRREGGGEKLHSEMLYELFSDSGRQNASEWYQKCLGHSPAGVPHQSRSERRGLGR